MKKLRHGDLFRSMSDIDQRYIDEAARPPAPRRVHPVRWAALAACLALAVGVSIMLPLLLWNPPAAGPSDPETSSGHSGGNPVIPPMTVDIPVWYAPGALSAQTLTYASGQIRLPDSLDNGSPDKMSFSAIHPALKAAASTQTQANNKEITLPSDARVIDCYNATLLQLEPSSVEGHGNCSGLFFDTETGKLICLSETLRDRLNGEFPDSASLWVTAYSAQSNRCLFSIQSDGGRSRKDYVYDFSSDKLIELPAVVGKTDTVAALIPIYSSDLRFVAAVDAADGSGPASLHLVRIGEADCETEHIADYVDEYVEPYKRLLFSPDSRYMAYALPTKDNYSLVGTTAGTWIMRDLSSGAQWQGEGKILRFTAAGNAVIVRTESDVRVLDIATGTDITDTSTLQEWEKLEITVADLGNDFTGSRIRITLNPLFGGDPRVIKEDVGAYFQSGDYLYTYTNGDATAECLSLTSGESFQVPVDQAYLQQVASLPETLLVYHQLYLSDDGTRLLLRYSTSIKDPNAELAWYRGAYNLPDLERLFDTYGSLAEMEEYFRQGMNPPSFDYTGEYTHVEIPTYSYFQGDGYACVVHQTENPEQTLLFMDDYRDNTFTIYTSHGMRTSYWPARANQDPNKFFRKALPADVKQAGSVSLYASLYAYEDAVDMAEYYTGGKFDSDKMKRRELEFDRIQSLIFTAYIMDYTRPMENGGIMGYDVTDISPVEELLQIATSKPTIGWVTLQAERETKGASRQYEFNARGVLEFSVGRLANGKGMVVFNSQYRALDDAEYQRVLEICDAMYDTAQQAYADEFAGFVW